MSCCVKGCKTINLAKLSMDTLKQQEKKLHKPMRKNPCQQVALPPPPRMIEKPMLTMCRPRAVTFLTAPYPCICPPCPVCPSRKQQFSEMFTFGFKLCFMYCVVDFMRESGIWGEPDGNAELVTAVSNGIMTLMYGRDPEEPPAYGANGRIGFMDVDSIKYHFFRLWDKSITSLFWITFGYPLSVLDKTIDSVFSSNEAKKEAERVRKLKADKEKKEAEALQRKLLAMSVH